MEAAEGSNWRKRKPGMKADELSSGGVSGLWKVDQERSPLKSTDARIASENQLKYIEHGPESSACRKGGVEQKADKLPEGCNGLANGLREYESDNVQLIKLLIAERELTQSYKARIEQLLNNATRKESNVAEALAEKETKIVALKKQLAESENHLASLQVENSLLTHKLQDVEALGHQEGVYAPTYQRKAAYSPTQLCDIPNEVLLQILSFLPLEDAVRTSVLSKRWRQLWALVPDFHIKIYDISKGKWFLDFVERACALRGGYAMRSFSLVSCVAVRHETQISKLITAIVTAVVTCGVKALSLLLLGIHNYVLPLSIFMCAPLERLQVQSSYLIRLPSSICLGKLKVLILQSVIFDDIESMEKLFSIPSLEKLEIENCSWRKLKSICISAPNLQHLHINRLCSSDHVLHINGACLKSFHYHGGLLGEYHISGDTTQFVEAELLVYPARHGKVDRGYKLLSAFCNLEKLTISDPLVQDLATRDELPLFSNLIKLTVGGVNLKTVRGVWALLRRSPHLRSLHFMAASNYYPENGRDELLHPVPSCFSTELEIISLSYTHRRCRQVQLFMAGFFLEKVVSLREMVVRIPSKGVSKRKLLEDISKLPKGSKKCRFSFQTW